MSDIPATLRYAKSHEWLDLAADGTATIGSTDYAQASLGDITYVQLPKDGATLKAGEVFGVVESVKAASDLYAPVAGTVTATNAALNTAPETVNAAPYAAGWMLKLRLAHPTDVVDLGNLPELRGIKVEGNSVTLGAMTRHAEVAASAEVRKANPALAALNDGRRASEAS